MGSFHRKQRRVLGEEEKGNWGGEGTADSGCIGIGYIFYFLINLFVKLPKCP